MWSFEKNVSEKKEKEIWKLSTYPEIAENSYYVSSYGRIKNALTGRILKPYVLVRDEKTENVYEIIKLKYRATGSYDIRYKNFRVHRLIAWEFCEIPKGCTVVEHINDNKLDNYFRNLKWSTPGENTRNAMKTGRLKLYGENNITSKYSERLIHFLCGLMEEELSLIEILKIWCGKDSTARSRKKEYALLVGIRNGTKHTNISKQYNFHRIKNLNKDELQILKLIETGYENIAIMKKYGFNHIEENTALYTKILICRKMFNNGICSTTIEKRGNTN